MVKVGFNIHLFDYLSEDKNQAIGSAELAEKTGVERALLSKNRRVVPDFFCVEYGS